MDSKPEFSFYTYTYMYVPCLKFNVLRVGSRMSHELVVLELSSLSFSLLLCFGLRGHCCAVVFISTGENMLRNLKTSCAEEKGMR